MSNDELARSSPQQFELGQIQPGETQLGHTQLGHTQLGHTQLGHTQLGDTQLGDTQLGDTQAGQIPPGPNELKLRELSQAYARCVKDASWPRARGSVATEFLPQAELELLDVHHTEIARVLTRAVKWLERRAGGPRLAAFQRRAVGAVAAARDSGAWVPSAAERVARRQPTEWPSKLQLARAAFELEPTVEHEELLQRFQNAGVDA